MSDSLLLSRLSLPRTAEPYRVAVRRLRWFRSALLHQLDVLSDQTGITYDVEGRLLAAAFVAWLRRVEEQKPRHPAHRQAFFDFAAGLMLQELLSKMPIRATLPTCQKLGEQAPVRAWPEGFACTIFCINMLAAVKAQECEQATEIAPDLFDTRVWDSFRENVQEQASRAIGFLHLFVGGEPDWLSPALFGLRFEAPGKLVTSEPAMPSHPSLR